MSYSPLNEILAELDLLQRREITVLSERVDQKRLTKKRDAKRQLSSLALFFIERSWEVIGPQVVMFKLEHEARKSEADLRAYIVELYQRHSAYAWGWTRARMSAWLMRRLEECVPELLTSYPEKALEYASALRDADHYGFRVSAMHHLKAGYHTALCVACKWHGTACELIRTAPPGTSHAMPQFRDELRLFATFSMSMLARSDGYLWNSAGAEPMDAEFENGILKPATREIEEVPLENVPDFGVRLGCPALRAKSAEGPAAFMGIVQWVEREFGTWLK